MKRARGGKTKGGKKAADEAAGLGGEEALQLKAVIESAGGVHTLGAPQLLRALGADRRCDATHPKSKVGPLAAATWRRQVAASAQTT